MTKTKLKNYIFLHFTILLYSLVGISSKLASFEEFLSVKFILVYGLLIMCLIIYAILWQQVLKNMTLSLAFANKSVTMIWGMIWGNVFFNENITINMILGSLIVLLGVCIVVTENE